MSYLLICTVAVLASGLTFFSGFGLGTLLMPVFALFFPVPLAVAMTAVVHFLNNLFKLVLVGKHADRASVLAFGAAAIPAALAGAWLLSSLAGWDPLFTWTALGRECAVTPVKIVVAVLLVFFAAFEVVPALRDLSFDRRFLPVGGLLAGFLGGLTGHQGALRSAFLIRAGLGKEALVATGVVLACVVDVVRLAVYGTTLAHAGLQAHAALVGAATASAFAGAWAGNRLLKKVTLRAVQGSVAVMLIVIALAMGTGLV
ncbi:MAG: TSUP family transporter [Deltaproteobacteria bacterium]|nr:TSUP family transporter [Deltaproteobacteria bacterium]